MLIMPSLFWGGGEKEMMNVSQIMLVTSIYSAVHGCQAASGKFCSPIILLLIIKKNRIILLATSIWDRKK